MEFDIEECLKLQEEFSDYQKYNNNSKINWTEAKLIKLNTYYSFLHG